MATEALEWKAKGNAALSAKDFDGAIEAYSKAIELDPTQHVFFSNRSAAYLSCGKAEEALKDAEQVVSIKADWPKGYGRKGSALHALGKFDDAIAAFEAGLKVDPGNAALQSGLEEVKAAQAGPAPGPMPGMANPFGPDMWGKLASNPKFAAYLQDPGFTATLKKLQEDPKTLNASMSDPRLIEVLGFLLGIPMAPAAEQPFAPSSAPASAAAPAPAPEPAPEPPRELTEEEKKELELKTRADELKAAGTAAYRKREFEEALRLYGEADEVNPDGANISYRLNQAAVHFELKAYDECIAVCTKAIDDGRDSGAAFPMLAKAYARIGNANVRKGDFPAAIEAYERSLMESHSDDVYNRLKRTKADMKKAEEQAYLDPEKAKEAKEAGNELFKAGDFKGAIEQYSDAIRRDPTQAVYYANRGAARTKIMDFNEAMKDVDKAIELDPKYVRAYSRKGALQFLMKEFHKAMVTYEKGLELDPENEELKDGLRRTVQRINQDMSAAPDEERAARAMADPEIQGILRDPMVQQVLKDFRENPRAAQAALTDPVMAPKLSKLMAAGVLRMG